jgi:hypothetical protein
MEGKAKDATHSSIWESLSSVEYILTHLEGLKEKYDIDDTLRDIADDTISAESRRQLKVAIKNAWAKLNK